MITNLAELPGRFEDVIFRCEKGVRNQLNPQKLLTPYS